jgi:hypothetical protein
MAQLIMDLPWRAWGNVDTATLRRLTDLATGTSRDPDATLEDFRELAQRGDAAQQHVFALALAAAGDLPAAAAELSKILRERPDAHDVRLNLAKALTLAGHYDSARQEASRVAQASTDEEEREYATILMQKIDHALKYSERAVKFARLRLLLLRERVARGEADRASLRDLANMLVRLRSDDAKYVSEAIAILEQLREANPNDIEVIEDLAFTFVYAFDTDASVDEILFQRDKWDELLLELERKKPHSSLLTALRRVLATTEPSGPDLKDRQQDEDEQTERLFARAMSDEPGRDRALEELRHFVHSRRGDDSLGLNYLMFAEERAGNHESALSLADKLASEPDLPHEYHFNLGQLFWAVGATDRGRYHLDQAYATARNDNERQDATEMLAALLQRNPARKEPS